MWCSHSNKISPLWLDCVISFDWLQTLFFAPFQIKRTTLLNPPEFTDLYGASDHCCTCLCFNTSYSVLQGCGFTSWHASVLRGQGHVKVHVPGPEGAWLCSRSTVTCRKHGDRSCWETRVITFDTAVKGASNHRSPLPPLPNTAAASLYLLSGISTDHGYEYLEQWGGSRAAPCPCQLSNESCGPFVIWSASEMKMSFCWLWSYLGREENRGSVWSKNGKRVTIFSRKHFSGGEREQTQLEFKCSSCRLLPCF